MEEWRNTKGQLHRLDGPAQDLGSSKLWYQNGKRHRLDGPAVEWVDGRKEWYQNGKLHRLDGPAMEYTTIANGPSRRLGHNDWYQNGQLHRLDGPAVEWADGCKEWYQNGQRHRIYGPAYEWSNGKEWYQNGKRHRIDGPAVEWSNGKKWWYLNGVRMSESEFNQHIAKVSETSDGQFPRMIGCSTPMIPMRGVTIFQAMLDGIKNRVW